MWSNNVYPITVDTYSYLDYMGSRIIDFSDASETAQPMDMFSNILSHEVPTDCYFQVVHRYSI